MILKDKNVEHMSNYLKLIRECDSNNFHLKPDIENNMCNHCFRDLVDKVVDADYLVPGRIQDRILKDELNFCIGFSRYLESLKKF